MTLLGVLNFFVLQWFGVRLACAYSLDEIPGWQRGRAGGEIEAAIVALGGRWWSRYAPPRGVRIHWQLVRWVVPLTGWWSRYRWIARRS